MEPAGQTEGLYKFWSKPKPQPKRGRPPKKVELPPAPAASTPSPEVLLMDPAPESDEQLTSKKKRPN